MPFKLKRFYSPKKQRAFKFLIDELGISQRDSQRHIANGRLFIDGKPMTKPTAEVEGLVIGLPSINNLPFAIWR